VCAVVHLCSVFFSNLEGGRTPTGRPHTSSRANPTAGGRTDERRPTPLVQCFSDIAVPGGHWRRFRSRQGLLWVGSSLQTSRAVSVSATLANMRGCDQHVTFFPGFSGAGLCLDVWDNMRACMHVCMHACLRAFCTSAVIHSLYQRLCGCLLRDMWRTTHVVSLQGFLFAIDEV
jgi:hypothetical protein